MHTVCFNKHLFFLICFYTVYFQRHVSAIETCDTCLHSALNQLGQPVNDMIKEQQ